eukprot:635598_1
MNDTLSQPSPIITAAIPAIYLDDKMHIKKMHVSDECGNIVHQYMLHHALEILSDRNPYYHCFCRQHFSSNGYDSDDESDCDDICIKLPDVYDSLTVSTE